MNRTLAVVMVLVSMSISGTHADDMRRTISTSGKASENVKPTVAFVTLFAQGEGILMVDAARKADTVVTEILAAINTATNGIRATEVTDIAIGEKTQEYWRSDEKASTPKPEITRRIFVTCDPDPVVINELVDRAIRAGATMQTPSRTSYSDDIRSVVVYGLDDTTDLVARLDQQAMDDARSRGDKLAKLAGKARGDVVSVGCGGSSGMSFPVRVMGRKADFPSEYISIDADAVQVERSISVTFELKDP